MSDSTSIPADQPETTAFSIPAALMQRFPGRPVILRTADPAEARALFGPDSLEAVVMLEVTGLAGDMTLLADWGQGLPLDLMMADPVTELPLLYRCTGLLARHPVRVTVPFRRGLAGAVKLALALGFAVRLHGHQPTPEAVAEARQALAEYLHNPTVAQSVEPFQGVLISLLHGTPISLWSLLERDSAELQLIDDGGAPAPGNGPASITGFRDALLAAGAECRECPWLPRCNGYFKWPDSDYACTDVKGLLGDIEAAANQLRADLDAHAVGGG